MKLQNDGIVVQWLTDYKNFPLHWSLAQAPVQPPWTTSDFEKNQLAQQRVLLPTSTHQTYTATTNTTFN